ncbi:MAG: glycosyltransferase family 39 protein [Chloroflexi bacterium]|nr:glycosyltransferase family 39 protein [Chloroflexota bacterium]
MNELATVLGYLAIVAGALTLGLATISRAGWPAALACWLGSLRRPATPERPVERAALAAPGHTITTARCTGRPTSRLSGRVPALVRPWLAVAAWTICAGLLATGVVLEGRLLAQPDTLGAFWPLLGVGMLFAVVVRLGLPKSDAPGEERSSSDAAHVWPIAGRGVPVLCAAVAVEAVALALFRANRLLTLAWVLHVLAVVGLLAGLWLVTRARVRVLTGSWSRTDSIWLGLLTFLALLPRVWAIRTIPQGIWFDEAQRGLEALRMLADPGYRPIFAAGILQEPTGLWYAIAPLVAVYGRDPFALRLPVAIGGTLGVGALYLLGRVLFGQRVAVVTAGLAIGLTWHLNFSRIALPAIISVSWDILAAALFVLGLRRRSPFLLGSAGVAAGAGLYFYYTSQLTPLILAVVGLHQLAAGRMAFLRTQTFGLVVCALAFLLTAGPFAQFAITNPGQFAARAGTVTVFKEVEQAGSWEPLVRNVRAHLLMFNVRGDSNGRHNWTGRPMLDPVTGALAVAGLALALTRFWRVERWIVLVWLPAALAGGIFSLTWEAPQSHRAIGAIVPALLLAALPVGTLWLAADRLLAQVTPHTGSWFRGASSAQLWPARASSVGGVLTMAADPGSIRWQPPRSVLGSSLPSLVAVCMLLVGTGIMNVDRFFTRQERDSRTWLEFSAPQTEAARQIAQLPPTTKVYLEPSWLNQPSIGFIVPEPRPYAPFDPASDLPVTDHEAAIFIADRPDVAGRITELYPGAARTEVRPPESGSVAVYGFRLSPDVLQANRGVDIEYRSGERAVLRRASSLELGWPGAAPIPAPFEATATTTWTVPAYGAYRIALDGPPQLSLTLDGVELLHGGSEGLVRLARGNHALRLHGVDMGQQPIAVRWGGETGQVAAVTANLLTVPPVRPTGLLGRVYPGRVPTGEPVVEQVDPNVELRVHLLPAPRPYTIEWSGALRAERSGVYHFGVSSVGTSSIAVDGVTLATATVPNVYSDGTAELEAGWHDITVHFVDDLNFSNVTAFWQPPDHNREVIPTSALRPWPAYLVGAALPADAALPTPSGPVAGGGSGPRLTPIAPPEMPLPGPPLRSPETVGGSGALGQPRGLAATPDGSLVATDARRRGVALVSPSGVVRSIGQGAFEEPSAVAPLPDGAFAVVDAATGKAYRLESDGTVGESLFADYPLYGPRGISLGPEASLVLADTGNDRLLVRRPDGTVDVIRGLSQPTSAIVLDDGTFVVAEAGADRIVKVQRDGRRLASWSMPHSTTVLGPQVAAFGRSGWVVTAPEERALIVHAPDSTRVEQWPLGPDVRRPVGVAVVDNRLVVGDADGGSLVGFNLP